MSPSTFQWDDPFLFHEQLSPEQKLVYETAHRYTQENLLPRITSLHRQEKPDTRVLKELGDMGFLGMSLKGYGCAGASVISYGLVARELERIDSSYRSLFSVQSSLSMYAIYAHGSEEQKNQFLPAMARGDKVGCFGLTEPNHGSDPASMETKAVPRGKSWILNGSKTWITNSPIADVLIIWAKDPEGHIRGFIVERGMKGLETPTLHGKLSLRTSLTGQIFLQDVEVPESHVLPDVLGLKGPLSCLNNARYSIIWGTLGAAEFCWHAARQYALDRHQFQKPLAANQLVQAKLVQMQSDIALAQQATLRAGQLKEQEHCPPELISLLKRNNAQMALNTARTARDMLGANGISDEYHVMRHLLNLESVNTYEGTYDIHTLILGRAQTGIAAF